MAAASRGVLISRSGRTGPVATATVTPRAEGLEQTGREVLGDEEGGDAALGGEVGDDVGRGGAEGGVVGRVLAAQLGLDRFEREDLVEARFLEAAAKLEGVEHGDFFAPVGEGGEGVVAFEAAKIEQVAARVGVGVEKERG